MQVCILFSLTLLLAIIISPTSSFRSHQIMIQSLQQRNSRSRELSCKLVEVHNADDDVQKLTILMTEISRSVETRPETALLKLSQELGWLLSRDVPKLSKTMLSQIPEEDGPNMLRAFSFTMDFLEAVSKETSSLLKRRQASLRAVMEAAKKGEEELNRVMKERFSELSDAEFLVFLNSEIDNQASNPAMESFLVTIKLRILEEVGRSRGIDIAILPKLAAEENLQTMRVKTLQYIAGFDEEGKLLFLQTLGIVRRELMKRYANVDPTLAINLAEIEGWVREAIKSRQK